MRRFTDINEILETNEAEIMSDEEPVPPKKKVAVNYTTAKKCYVWQCWLICTILLELSRGIVSCILLIANYIECTVIHNAHLWVLFYIGKIT